MGSLAPLPGAVAAAWAALSLAPKPLLDSVSLGSRPAPGNPQHSVTRPLCAPPGRRTPCWSVCLPPFPVVRSPPQSGPAYPLPGDPAAGTLSSPPDGAGEVLLVFAGPQTHLPLLGRGEAWVSPGTRRAVHGAAPRARGASGSAERVNRSWASQLEPGPQVPDSAGGSEATRCDAS